MIEGGWTLKVGAQPEYGGTRFRLWSPGSDRVEVVIDGRGDERAHALEAEGAGWFSGFVAGVGPGARYRYRLDGGACFPDPASRFQPDGVHGPSEVVDPNAFGWSDEDWQGRELADLVVYELHVGTFTPEGTFEAAIDRLDHLVSLGVTALELMPVANFAGRRNWGYDGVNLYAPATAYGGPTGLKQLVDAAHARRLAVVLDVVYNHLGPEGNYLPAITHGRYFTDRHCTPWGDAVNYDGPGSEGVRELVLSNALYWIHEYHVDGLRLDATHAIVDDSPVHVLRELAERAHDAVDRPIVVIAEDERNERRLILPAGEGGLGLDAVWADDLHHELRRLAAGDREGYYASYGGTVAEVAETLRRGWYYEGQRAPHRGEPRGTSAAGLPPERFVHCIQNHDQVGNRAFGTRVSDDVEPGVYRALSALLLLSPYLPLLWMGQEWAASTPFQFFTDFPEELGRLVTEGRRAEFGHFAQFSDPALRETIPDPQAEETFLRSRLDWGELQRPAHASMLRLYRELLRLRRDSPALREHGRASFSVSALGGNALVLRRSASGGEALLLVVCFAGSLREPLDRLDPATPPGGAWSVVLATEEERFGGSGNAPRLSPDGVLEIDGPGAVLLAG
jgi:maltooligosyltrehalose trehalohydrolase